MFWNEIHYIPGVLIQMILVSPNSLSAVLVRSGILPFFEMVTVVMAWPAALASSVSLSDLRYGKLSLRTAPCIIALVVGVVTDLNLPFKLMGFDSEPAFSSSTTFKRYTS